MVSDLKLRFFQEILEVFSIYFFLFEVTFSKLRCIKVNSRFSIPTYN